MTHTPFFIAVIGKGDGPGLEANVVEHPMGATSPGRKGRTSGIGAPDDQSVPPDLTAVIGQKWATVPSTFHPPPEPDGFTVKVSRHRDSWDQEWFWVGLYQTVSFAGDTRGGSYFGAGLAMQDLPPPAIIYDSVQKVFAFARQQLFLNGQMAKSVFSLEFQGLALPRLTESRPVDANRGLDPLSTKGRFIELRDVYPPTVSRHLDSAVQSDEFADYSTLYLANWRDEQLDVEFYVKRDAKALTTAPAAPIMPPSLRADGGILEGALHCDLPDASAAAVSGGSRRLEENVDATPDLDDRVMRKLLQIEKDVRKIRELMSTAVPGAPQLPPSETSDEDWLSGANKLMRALLIGGIVIILFLLLYTVGTSAYDAMRSPEWPGAPSQQD